MDSSPDGDALKRSKMRDSKRPRKSINPTRFDASVKPKGKCKNLACQATLKPEDLFCKRCSCCICRKYDANKDTSLWLTCESDPPFAGESCGLSCHLQCAFKNDKSGLKDDKNIDGGFYCVSCGKTNSLLECWKKQLVIAKDTTKVDVLCFRLALAQKLLKGTDKYIKQSETVEEAVKILETELCGPLTDLPSAMCRGNVDRLHSAPKVKDLCSSALDSLIDTLLNDHSFLTLKMQGTTKMRFEDVDATELTLILGSEEEEESIMHHGVWHRKVSEEDYTNGLTCSLVSPNNTRFIVSGLTPATEYCFKVVSFADGRLTSIAETNVFTKTSQEEGEELSSKDEKAVNSGKNSSSSCGLELEDCVKVLRQLERSGYVDKNFRQKFLTWYSLNASAHKKNVVKIFINGFKDDLEALAEQLIHTFSDCISRKRSAIGDGNASCMKQRP